ncbi:Uncharacterised protein [Mycobacteroides abscessus subsp. abscessus]|nr:Uncharacterised protein [Mycobacteroides abscessus subsp. abscessus]
MAVEFSVDSSICAKMPDIVLCMVSIDSRVLFMVSIMIGNCSSSCGINLSSSSRSPTKVCILSVT